jgi:hypothetical protein
VGELGLGIVLSTVIGRDELRTLTGQAAQLVEALLASMTSPALPGGSPVQASRYATRPEAGILIVRVRSNDQAVRKNGRAERRLSEARPVYAAPDQGVCGADM